jgi:hypothetical protein
MTEIGCVFCHLTRFRAADVCIENALPVRLDARSP